MVLTFSATFYTKSEFRNGEIRYVSFVVNVYTKRSGRQIKLQIETLNRFNESTVVPMLDPAMFRPDYKRVMQDSLFRLTLTQRIYRHGHIFGKTR